MTSASDKYWAWHRNKSPGRKSENNNRVVFRIRGLEFAQLQLGRRSRLTFGLGMPAVVRTESDWGHLKETVEQILAQQSIALRAGNSRYAPTARAVARKPAPAGYSSYRCAAGSTVCLSAGSGFPRWRPRDD